MNSVDIRWFNGRSLVGIARVDDKHEGIRYYIAAVPHPSTEDADTQFVVDWGSSFPANAGYILFNK